MLPAVIRELRFDGPGDFAVIVVTGYPDEGIGLAREMFTKIFSPYGRWHITEINCEPPEAQGKKYDSEWRVSVSAALKVKEG